MELVVMRVVRVVDPACVILKPEVVCVATASAVQTVIFLANGTVMVLVVSTSVHARTMPHVMTSLDVVTVSPGGTDNGASSVRMTSFNVLDVYHTRWTCVCDVPGYDCLL